VRRSVSFRLLAFVLALLGSLAAPGLALTHGLAHAHLARHHEQHHEASAARSSPTPTLDAPDDDHAHGHATVDVAPGARDVARLQWPPATLPAVPARALVLRADLVVVRSPALTDRALLARPDPDGGPPPRLRAPPAV
jgi:hypothetical protein